jgi:hypothetical protein
MINWGLIGLYIKHRAKIDLFEVLYKQAIKYH